MGFYYPQAALTLRITWENFGDKASPALNTVHSMQITPKRVTVKINDYRTADTFSAEVDYKNFPFDPRLIRALGVTVHMRDMESLVDAAGKVQQIEPGDNLLPTGNKDVVFQGFADEDSISLDDTSRTVRFEGRDFTGLLADKPFDQGSISMFIPLNGVIQNLLFSNPYNAS